MREQAELKAYKRVVHGDMLAVTRAYSNGVFGVVSNLVGMIEQGENPLAALVSFVASLEPGYAARNQIGLTLMDSNTWPGTSVTFRDGGHVLDVRVGTNHKAFKLSGAARKVVNRLLLAGDLIVGAARSGALMATLKEETLYGVLSE